MPASSPSPNTQNKPTKDDQDEEGEFDEGEDQEASRTTTELMAEMSFERLPVARGDAACAQQLLVEASRRVRAYLRSKRPHRLHRPP